MNLPRSGRPSKISTKAECKIIKEITKKQHPKNCKIVLPSKLKSKFLNQQSEEHWGNWAM